TWKLGGHPWADMTTFSFHPVKTLTTGEGGMLVTDNDEYARRARLLRSHGMEREPQRFVGLGSDDPVFTERGPWLYEMQELGYNYRITDLQCALGRSQLRKLGGFMDRRREIVSRYNDAFAGLPLVTPPGLANPGSRDSTSWHLYTVQIAFQVIGKTRTEVMAALRESGVGTQVLYIPVHLQPWYRENHGFALGRFPVAESFYGQALSLPLYPGMSDEDVDTVVAAVRDVVG
ncbi:MAG: DegT/DnrJ/EryC1/StrS family aminotransferase, partial [Verrucomicrobia bacterium]|nr:DegT/DnrJ/EryC1/StrS family aminotransferase [Verrucomicrobiota bacterium]